jgi:Tfp pilus assembly protein PilF
MPYKNGVSRPRLIALLLAVITLGLYVPAAWFGFSVFDDGLYVTDNPTVQAGVTWAGVKWAFTTMAASNWHPLTWLSHMVDCGLFGLNPAGPHLENALIHAVNAALLFVLLLRLTSLRADASDRQTGQVWPCAFIAALFAWHPMHVESVAWIAERKDVLSTFFALLALLAYVDYVAARKQGVPRAGIHYGLSLLAFTLGLLAKPMVVTLPCVLLLLDFWPLRRMPDLRPGRANLKLLIEKWPYFLITALSCVLTFLAQSQTGGKAVASLQTVPWDYRLKNVPVAYAEYLWKTFWPAKLAIFYPLQDIIPLRAVAVAVAVLLLVSLIAWRGRYARPYLLTGWLWFLGMLVPVIGIVQVGSAALADRYSYLPSVGIFIMVTFALGDAAERFRWPKCVLAGAGTAVLVVCMALTENQLRYWQNSVTLFRHALAVTADNDTARNNLGVALQQQGHLAQAVEQYRIAARLEPNRYQARSNLASALEKLGHPKAALAEYRQAVELGTNQAFLHVSYGQALAADGQTGEALRQFSIAAQLDPHSPWSHVEIAKIDLRQGRDTEALKELRLALRAEPDNADVLAYTAQLLSAAENPALRDGHAAFILAARANLLTGGRRPFILDVLGMACAEMGRFDDAELAAKQALRVAAAMNLKGLEPIRHRLALYQNHQPWRQSFGDTNAVSTPGETNLVKPK